MSDTTSVEVTLTINGVQVSVPEGTLIVDAARKAGINIPVFCYHPKMEPVGMCRMCLVEIGRPVVDRTTGDQVLEEDGSPKLQFGWKLETACTTPVADGMVVYSKSDPAKDAQKEIIEFILTSHPLDCPICDKGGECPLQNLTMAFGPGESRFLYDEKIRLDKHVPLGELIFLDRERCIQCARCVRFQEEIVDDPVIGFYNRGRSLEIVTFSEPGFDSYFSGNTTDICPVGALTTADFRFGARPWELDVAASICNQCSVGCNLSLNTRREAMSGGQMVVKRAMPRQNEAVNEIWICDKGRFGYHFAQHPERLTKPLVRRDGEMVPTSWEEALSLVASRFKEAGAELLTLAGGRLPNEDLYNLAELTDGLGGRKVLYSSMGGGDITPYLGLAPGSNFSDMGDGSAIVVVACDLENEAPVLWLRVKQAAERGVKIILINPRRTKLDRVATHSLRYSYGNEAASLLAMVNTLSAKRPDLPTDDEQLQRNPELAAAARTFAEAENGVVVFGSEGMGLNESTALAQACANLLQVTGHVGKPNNGLLGVWERANDQGAWDMGFRPAADLSEDLQEKKALYIVAADPAGDDPSYLADAQGFLVVQDLFLTPTAKLADVVLPVGSWLERQGTYTSAARHVQMFYPALPVHKGLKPDYSVTGEIGSLLEIDQETRVPGNIFERIAGSVGTYAGLTYGKLAEVKEQWPIVGRDDLYYGGTTYENSQGLGVQLPLEGTGLPLSWPDIPETEIPRLGLLAVPITRLYDLGTTILPSELLHQRIHDPYLIMNSRDAERMRIPPGSQVRVVLGDKPAGLANVEINDLAPERVVLIPRSYSLPISGPDVVEIKLVR